MSMHSWFFACASFVILFLTASVMSCATNPVTGQTELMLVSEQQELQLGVNSAPSLKWEFGGQYQDRELHAYLDSVVKRLWQNSERAHLPVEFHIQNTSIPNAFALPGYVAITRGLLCDMENEAQFAAVMGHEIGHVMARHTAQRISRTQLQQIGLAIGAAALEASQSRDALLSLGALGSSLMLLKYDRGQEIQADRLGVKYMSTLGYDPREAISAHQVLERSVDRYLKRLGKSPNQDSFISTLLSTHPRTEVRLSEIDDMIQQLPPYSLRGDGKFQKQFSYNLRNIRHVNSVYHTFDKAEMYYKKKEFHAAETLLNEAVRKNSKQPPFYNLLGFIKLQKKQYQDAEEAFDRALAINPGFQPSLYGSGLVSYYRGNYSLAVSQFKRSLDEFPGHAQTHFGLGRSYFRLRQYRQAVPYLNNFAQAAPRNPEIHGMLGICYDNNGELERAVQEYAFQVQLAPDSDLGLHARKRLKELGVKLQ